MDGKEKAHRDLRCTQVWHSFFHQAYLMQISYQFPPADSYRANLRFALIHNIGDIRVVRVPAQPADHVPLQTGAVRPGPDGVVSAICRAAGLADFVEGFALVHQVVVGSEPAHGIDDVPVAQGPVVVQHCRKVGLLQREHMGADHLGAELVKGRFRLLRTHAEPAAGVLNGIVVTHLNVFVSQLSHPLYRSDRVLLHFLADGIQNQTNFQHTLTTPLRHFKNTLHGQLY